MQHVVMTLVLAVSITSLEGRAAEPPRLPDTPPARQVLVRAGHETGFSFGAGVKMLDDRLAVTNTLGVHLYRRGEDGWHEETQISPPEPLTDDTRLSVALDGDRCVIGCMGFEENRGAAWVYRHHDGAWSLEADLTPAGLKPDDAFGGAMSLLGSTCLIAARCDSTTAHYGGAVYVFVRKDGRWTQHQKLHSAATPPILFGASVALSDRHAAIGTASRDLTVYVYDRHPDGLREMARIQPPAGVGIHPLTFVDSDLLIGTCRIQPGRFGAARLYTLEAEQWTERQTFTDVPDRTENRSTFGRSVAAAGDILVIGAHAIPYEPDPDARVIVYRRSPEGWRRLAVLSPPERRYIMTVATNGDDIAVGVESLRRRGDGALLKPGAVYRWRVSELEPAPGRLTRTALETLTADEVKAMIVRVARARAEATTSNPARLDLEIEALRRRLNDLQ